MQNQLCPRNLLRGGLRNLGIAVLVVFLGCLAVSSAVQAGGIRYVVPGGANSGTCGSWETACELRYALSIAVSGDEVWVKAGAYRPAPQNGDRNLSFSLKKNVAIYGGFSGTETAREQRDWTANKTVLSGDLNGNDSGGSNKADNSYHVVHASLMDATAVLDGFTITGGYANGASGAVTRGGGVFNNAGSPTMSYLIIDGNFAQSAGGGMYHDGSSRPALTNITFSNNTVTQEGGGMVIYKSDPVLNNVTFRNNSAGTGGSGGGIFNWYGIPSLTNVTFEGNTANNGGGLYNDNGGASLTEVTFTENSTLGIAGGMGGGMYSRNNDAAYKSNYPVLKNVTFNNNTAQYGGGLYSIALDATYPNVTLSHVVFNGNSSGIYGGGMETGSGKPLLDQVIFNNNTSNYGGGYYIQTGSPKLTHVTFTGNQGVNGNGGGLYVSSTNLVMVDGVFDGNSALAGGGLHNNGGGAGCSVTIMNVIFNNNLATGNGVEPNGRGGGFYAKGCLSQVLANVIFASNRAAGYGGGLSTDNSITDIENGTFFGNSAAIQGGGINLFGPTEYINKVNNSIVWGNTAPLYPQISSPGTSRTYVNYSDVESINPDWGLIFGAGVISLDPLFEDPSSGNLHLQNGSPARDAGDQTLLPADTLDVDGDGVTTEKIPYDLDGGPRISGGQVDMGAYELPALSLPTITADPNSQRVCEGAMAVFSAAASGSPAPTVQWQMSANGGSTWSDLEEKTSTILSIPAQFIQNANLYHAVFTNLYGSATTSPAVLTIDTAPVVTAHPEDLTVAAFQQATFSATASGSPAPGVQWQESTDGITWKDLTGQNSIALSFPAAMTDNGKQFQAVFSSTSACGAHSVVTNPAVLSVQKQTATISFTDLGTTYDGNPKAATVNTTPGGLPVVVTYDGSSTLPQNAGTYAVVATIDDPNYQGTATGTLVIQKALLTVRADDKNKLVGEALPPLTASYSGFVKDENSSVLSGDVLLSTTATADSPAGSYPIIVEAGSLSAANYSFTFVNGTLTIEKANQTITFGPLVDKTYGDQDFAVSATTSSGLPVSFSVGPGSACTISGNRIHLTGAGICTVAAEQEGNGTYNPAPSIVQSFDIARAVVSISLSGLEAVYAGVPQMVVVTTTPAGVNVAVTYNGLPTPPTGAGSYAIVAAIDDPNYQGNPATGTLMIQKAPLTVRADDKSKIYGEPLPPLTASYSGFVNGEDTAVLIGEPLLTTSATLDSPEGNYPITIEAGTLSAANYNFTFVNGALMVVGYFNYPPDVGPISGPVDPFQVGITINTSTSFTDQDVLDKHTGVWEWGDGTSSDGGVIETDGSGNVTGSHAYYTPGVYKIILTVEDDDGGKGISTYQQYIVVYDPAGGFVTGGGWIDSPKGAYTDNPALSGKANFGFVSKYKKSATVPEGETEFQFQVADLDFHSKVYEWLVVSGPQAKFKGVGTINGSGSFKFMIFATDGQINGGGGTDKFRIKIWTENSDGVENIVYDNEVGAPVDASPMTLISGGSITIHTK